MRKKIALDTRRFLYMILFCALVGIDLIKNSQNGAVWAAAVNLTGICLAAMTALRLTWNTQKLRPYLILTGIWLICSAAGFFLWQQHPGKVYCGQFLTGAVNVLVLSLLTLRMIKSRRELPPLRRTGKIVLLLAGITAVLMTLSPYGSLWPLWFLWMFTLYFAACALQASSDCLPSAPGQPVSSRFLRENHALLDGMIDGVILGFFLVQIYAYGFRPYDEVRYKGAFSNCNMNALFYLVTYAMVLYRIHCLHTRSRTKLHRLWQLFYYLLAGMLLAFILFTMTRTALLTAAGITFFFSLFSLLVLHCEKLWKVLVQWAALGGIMICMILPVYLTIRYLPAILHHPIWYTGEYSENKVHSFDSYDSEKYITFEEFTDEAFGRLNIRKLLAKVESLGTLTVHAAEPCAENSSIPLTGADTEDSGKIRLEIYKLYGKNLNLAGHTLEEGRFPITPDYTSWHAQNLFLQIAFFYGLPAGLLCMLLLAGVILRTLQLLSVKRHPEALLMLLVWLVFFGFGLLEVVWYPGQLIFFLIFLLPGITLTFRPTPQATPAASSGSDAF